MFGGDPVRAGEVGDGPRHLHEAKAASRGQLKPATGGIEHPEPDRVEGAVASEGTTLESRVQRRAVCRISVSLALSGGGHPLADDGRAFVASRVDQRLKRHRWHPDTEIDPVPQRS